MNKIKTIDLQELKNIVKDSRSWNQLGKKFNINIGGNGKKSLIKYFEKNEIDISHFKGMNWAKGLKRPDSSHPVYSLEKLLVKNGHYITSNRLKNRLLTMNMLKYECSMEYCKINTWRNNHLVLHLDHINGDPFDNRIENLRLLCPNCHSLTDTFCKTNKSKKTKKCVYCNSIPHNQSKYCKGCKDDIINYECMFKLFSGSTREKNFSCKNCNTKIRTNKTGLCSKCYRISSRLYDRPSTNVLQNDVKKLGYTGTGKKYGVSDNTIRYWLKTN